MFAFPFLSLPSPSFTQYSQMALTWHCRVFRNIKLPLSCRLGLSSSRICKVHLQNMPDMVAASGSAVAWPTECQLRDRLLGSRVELVKLRYPCSASSLTMHFTMSVEVDIVSALLRPSRCPIGTQEHKRITEFLVTSSSLFCL